MNRYRIDYEGSVPVGYFARILALFLCFHVSLAFAEAEATFLGQTCLRGFEKTSMPREDAIRFCKCVEDEIRPNLSSGQRATIRDAQLKLERGEHIASDYFVSSGIRELVVAGQARCEAAFYPPSQPLMLKGGQLELTMRCDTDTRAPELFIYIRDGELLTKKERDRDIERMIKGNFDSEYAKVALTIDSNPQKPESWEIDVTGQIVSPPKPHALLAKLRRASTVQVTISRGGFLYQGSLTLANKIPPRWTPCGGVTSE